MKNPVNSSIIVDTPATTAKGGRASAFFAFDILWGPLLIKLWFIIMSSFPLYHGVRMMADTYRQDIDHCPTLLAGAEMGVNGYVVGAVFLVGGILMSRLFCELLIIPFKIYQKMDNSIK